MLVLLLHLKVRIATYDNITGTDIIANGLRATKLASPNARINTGIVTTLIVPKQRFTSNSGTKGWAGIGTAYVGVGIVTTLIIPDTNGYGGVSSPVTGWLGAPKHTLTLVLLPHYLVLMQLTPM